MSQAAPHPGDGETGTPIDLWGEYESLTDSKLFHEYLTRLVTGRDMHVIITASAETGVGKTTLAMVLAMLWDIHGWDTSKATLSPRAYATMYDEVPRGTVLLLDEVEIAADARRGTSRDNVTLSQAFAGKRYRQVFGIMTAPSRGWVDDRMSADSADYWIKCQETDTGRPKGEATVYRLKHNEHYETSYEKKHETISWPNLDHYKLKRQLDDIKSSRMEGTAKEQYVLREEYERLKRNYWNKCMKKTRYYMIHALREERDLSQPKISDVLAKAEELSDGEVEGLAQTSVSTQLRADSFEEVYSK